MEPALPDIAPLPAGPALRPLAPAVRTVWRIWLGGLTAALFVVVGIWEVVGWLAGAERTLPVGVTAAAVVVVGVTAVVVVPALRYRYWRFALRPEELYLERGVWNRVHTVVPLRRVQHLDVSQNLLEREFGLGKLIVHTAGTRSSDVVLPGLRQEEAEALRDTLKHHILDDVL